jgi:dinuclear metal center YbgI/SA1388 family protein
MTIFEFESILVEKLNHRLFSSIDSSLNGIQVGNLENQITKIALMVDSSLEGFKRAQSIGANLILVHHGMYWGKPIPIKNTHYNRIKFLLDNDIALFASHLPLDAHMELGNNISLGLKLGLGNIEPFGRYKGSTIGVKGELENPMTLSEVNYLLSGNSSTSYVIPGGNSIIKTIGIVSGGAPSNVLEAIDEGLDLFITGDKSHELYHNCIESGINMISAGHYLTETLGVQSLGNWITREYGIESIFIDIPTGA